VPPAIRKAGWDGGQLALFLSRYWFWVLIAVSALALGAWNLAERAPHAAASEPSQRNAAEADTSQSLPVEPRHARRTRPPKPPAESFALPADGPIEATPEPEAGGQHSDESVVEGRAALAAASESTPPSGKPVRADVQVSAFAGRWLYSPSAGSPLESGQYPATYVELSLVEENGILSGEYRARYKVSDRAVSPEVSFSTRGALAADRSATLDWVSRKGAKGKAQLTLRIPNVMHFAWWTTEFGSDKSALGSGSAELIRQRLP
jgi:hypothetical protein